MSWVAVAVGTVSAVGGAYASNRAARSQRQAADNATQAQTDMFYQNRDDMEPWRQAGRQGLDQLLLGLGIQQPRSATPETSRENFDYAAYLAANPDANEFIRTAGGLDAYDHWVMDGRRRNFTFNQAAQDRNRQLQEAQEGPGFGALNRDFQMSDFQQDPGFQFRRQQGEDAINRNALARGRYNSGSVLKGLQEFNSGLASQEYGNAFNRFRAQQGDRYNRIASLAGVGQTATSQVNQDRSNLGAAIGQNIIGAGNAAAAGQIGVGNAITGGISQGVNWYQGNQMLNALNRGR